VVAVILMKVKSMFLDVALTLSKAKMGRRRFSMLSLVIVVETATKGGEKNVVWSVWLAAYLYAEYTVTISNWDYVIP